MATLEFLTFFFVFFLTLLAAMKCPESRCQTYASPRVRFPFWLSDSQPPQCGYSSNFDLSCNQQQQTILTLSSSSGNFTVESINYEYQSMSVNDQNKCIAKRLLDNDFDFVGSPFRFEYSPDNYTFFNCSSQAPLLQLTTIHKPIPCLSSDKYKVFGYQTGSWKPSLPHCNIISTATIPIVSYELLDIDFGLRLTWGAPDCRFCELSGRLCGFKNASILQLDCSRKTYGVSSKAATFRLIISMGIPVIVCVTMFAFYIFTLIRDSGRTRINEPITELSSVARPQIHVIVSGLYDLTIESYPKTQLGEKWEFPNPEDSTCPICLDEYQPDESIRAIPECNHHFHSNCVDEWLRKNLTCPVCRNVPLDDSKKSFPEFET